MRAAEIRAEIGALLADLKPAHLVHVGAHEGEEVPYYIEAGVERITLVEPNPDLAARLRKLYPSMTVVEAACSDTPGSVMLHIPRRTNMATVEVPDWAEPTDIIEVEAVRLHDIAPDADAAVIDVQGHEFNVLDAAPWDSLRFVAVETCTVEAAALSPDFETMVSYMAERGFVVVGWCARDYDYIQRWAHGRKTSTGGEVRDVVFIRDHD